MRGDKPFVVKPKPIGGPSLIKPRPRKLITIKRKLITPNIESEEETRERLIRDTLQSIATEIRGVTDRLIREQYEEALDTVRETGDLEALINLTRYRRGVVPLDEFLYSDTYLGLDPKELYPGVLEALNALESEQYVEAVLKGAIGGGKRLAVDTPILTDKGWSTMGALVDGDMVYDNRGKLCRVVKAHKPEISQVSYRVRFSDGTYIDACAEHLWYTDERTPHGTKRGSVKTTQYIKDTLELHGCKAHSIPLIDGIDTPDSIVPITPYTLGAWLGDGNSDRGVITVGNQDTELLDHIGADGYDCQLLDYRDDRTPRYTLCVKSGIPFNDALRRYDLRCNKHIPDDYLYGSHRQRVALLQGLMDTDGHVRATGSCEITQKNKRLADDIMQLLWLLGLKPTRRVKTVNGADYHVMSFTAYRDHVEVFRLSRKLEAQPYAGAQAARQRSRTIVAIDCIEPTLMRCITVDSPDRLYLAGRQMQITHNTTIANLGMARSVYKLSCMRNPQLTFGVQQHSSIVFTIQSVRLSTAKKAVFEEFGKFLANSPYFKTVFPYDRRIASEMRFLQHNISILPVSSSDTGAISMNVIGGLLDEVNFMQRIEKSKSSNAGDDGSYDQAKALYLTLSKRRRSRFMHRGKLPGTLFLVSSSRYPDDFTEVKAAEAAMCGGSDEEIFVMSKSLWEAKGRDRYSPEEFTVLVGDERTRSRILKPEEVPAIRAMEGVRLLNVPMDFKREFDKDIDGSVRDFGGMTTLASHPFIQDRESIFRCMSLADQYDYQSCIGLEDVDLSISVPSVLESRLRLDVKTMRVAHADLAVTRDSAGLAIGHIAGTRTMETRDPETGKTTVEVLPVIAYDLILRIIPPRDGQIDFSKIRQIIYDLRDNYGLPIKVVTTDGFQSVDFRQTLAKKGFATDYVSMDKTTQPYKTLRDALYDGRVLLPRHQTLVKELTELEYMRNGSKEKVDHKPRGSKDVADAVCGVASYLLTRRSAWTTQPTFRGDSGLLLHGSRTGIGTVQLARLTDEEIGKTGGRHRITERKTSKRIASRRGKSA